MTPNKIIPTLWFSAHAGDISQVTEYYKAIFGNDFDAHLHGSAECAIQARFENQQISDVDGCDEVDVIHSRRDDMRA